MNYNLSVGLDADDDEERASYQERVQRGLAWLIAEGPDEGHLLQNLCVHLDELEVNMPDSCVLGWSSGGSNGAKRAEAYHARMREHGHRWGAENGFRLSDFEPHDYTAYEALTAEWKSALAEQCKEAEEA